MDPTRWHEIERLYHAALERDGRERAAFLGEACGADEALRREIELLLANESEAVTFLSQPALSAAAQMIANDPGASVAGTKIGSYQILSLLGAGGMGQVYRASDIRLGRDVAIKILRPSLDDERATLRFLREARALATVNHPNVCQIYEVGEDSGQPFIAMELLEGESLDSRLGRGALPLGEAILTAIAVLSALQMLHRRNIVHRDVKPSNVFLTPYGVKLLDFGLARHFDVSAAETELGLTMQGSIVGTHYYMAPEQLMGAHVDGRTDLFAVGVMLFEIIAGKRPFAGDSIVAVLHAILHEPAPSLVGSPGIAAVDRVVRRALAKTSDDRYPTADEMAQDLRDALPLVDSAGTARAQALTRLAVLPFRMLRADTEVESLAFGLADAVTASLAVCPSLVVRSSLLCARFASEPFDLQKVAAELDVDVVLAGVILATGERARVSAQLLAVADGNVMWSQTSEVPRSDLMELEDDLAAAVRSAVEIASPQGGRFGGAEAPKIQSIAVLPLENLSGDREQDYFADGMTEGLITDLAKLAGLKRVIARSSVMRFKGTDKTPRRIARELNVDALVTGAVLRSGDRVRITAQLIDPNTGDQLWGDRYERDLRDVLTLQNDILSSIAGHIKVKLTRQDAARFASARPVNPEAYELCLKGRFYLEKLSNESFDLALEHYELALKKEPDFALAHAGIGLSLLARAHMGFVPPAEAMAASRVAIARAIELDDMLPDVHFQLASNTYYFEWDWSGAERALERAFELNPNHSVGHQLRAELLLLRGQRAEAAAALDRCLELDPLNPWTQTSIGGRYLRIDRDDEGVALLEKALRTDPKLALAHQYLATAFYKRGAYAQAVLPTRTFLALKGHQEAADALWHGYGGSDYRRGMRLAAESLAARASVVYVQPTWVAALYAFVEDDAHAFEWLGLAYEAHDSWLVFLPTDPRFRRLQGDPRFTDLLQRMNIPHERRAP